MPLFSSFGERRREGRTVGSLLSPEKGEDLPGCFRTRVVAALRKRGKRKGEDEPRRLTGGKGGKGEEERG